MKRSAMPARTTPMRQRRAGKRRTLAVHDGCWLDQVRSLEYCVRCGKAHVEAAHRDEGKGMSSKTDDCATAALCGECHFEIGNGKTMTRDERRAEMNHWIVETVIKLFRAGKIGATA